MERNDTLMFPISIFLSSRANPKENQLKAKENQPMNNTTSSRSTKSSPLCLSHHTDIYFSIVDLNSSDCFDTELLKDKCLLNSHSDIDPDSHFFAGNSKLLNNIVLCFTSDVLIIFLTLP